MSTFTNAADLLNHINLGVFEGKNGKFYVRVINKDGKKFFVDRKAVKQADGTDKWQWVMGKEIEERVAQPQAQLALTVS